VDLKINDKLNITLADLGREGCLKYVFNAKARERVEVLLDYVTGPSFNQDQVADWLKARNRHYSAANQSPLAIATHHPVLYKKMMSDIERQIHAGNTCA
jgi:hypothetical protein